MFPSLNGTFYRRLAVTAAALAAYRLGCHLPLPGLASGTLGQILNFDSATFGRVSIFALGITPLLTVLILAELVKIIVPSVRRWEHASPRNAGLLDNATVYIAILTAILQGSGIASGLEGVPGLVLEPGIFFRAACTATLVAGAALVIALARLIDRRGLGNGVWLIFLAPTIADLLPNVAAIATAYGAGQYPLQSVFHSIVFSVLAIAAIVAIMLAARASTPVAAACIWPLPITYTLLAWVLLGIGLAVSGGQLERATTLLAPASPVRHLTLALLVMLIAWLYVRSNRAAGLAMAVPAAPIVVALATIALAGEVLASQLSTAFPFGTVQLIVTAVVATVLLHNAKAIGAASPEAPAPEIPKD